MRFHLLLIVVTSVLFFLLLFLCEPGERAGNFTISDSGSKFALFQNSQNIQNWHEWWYVNFHERQSGIEGRFLLFTHGDMNSLRYIIGIHSSILENSKELLRSDELFLKDEYHVDQGSAVVRMGKHLLKMVDKDTLEVHIEPEDGKFELDLKLKRVTPGFSRKEGILTRPEDVFWIVPMPLAKVEGVLKYGNTTRKIEGWGYHDHNYGLWEKIRWMWGEIGNIQRNISLVFIKARIGNETKGGLIMLDSKGIVFQIPYPNFDVKIMEGVVIDDISYPTLVNITGKGMVYSVHIEAKNVTETSSIMEYSGEILYGNKVAYEFENVRGFFEY